MFIYLKKMIMQFKKWVDTLDHITSLFDQSLSMLLISSCDSLDTFDEPFSIVSKVYL